MGKRYTIEEGIIKAREYGFITFDPYMSETEEPEDCLLFIPSQEMDIQQYFQFLFSSTKEELDELMEEYPLVEQKYLLLQDATTGYRHLFFLSAFIKQLLIQRSPLCMGELIINRLLKHSLLFSSILHIPTEIRTFAQGMT